MGIMTCHTGYYLPVSRVYHLFPNGMNKFPLRLVAFFADLVSIILKKTDMIGSMGLMTRPTKLIPFGMAMESVSLPTVGISMAGGAGLEADSVHHLLIIGGMGVMTGKTGITKTGHHMVMGKIECRLDAIVTGETQGRSLVLGLMAGSAFLVCKRCMPVGTDQSPIRTPMAVVTAKALQLMQIFPQMGLFSPFILRVALKTQTRIIPLKHTRRIRAVGGMAGQALSIAIGFVGVGQFLFFQILMTPKAKGGHLILQQDMFIGLMGAMAVGTVPLFYRYMQIFYGRKFIFYPFMAPVAQIRLFLVQQRSMLRDMRIVTFGTSLFRHRFMYDRSPEIFGLMTGCAVHHRCKALSGNNR